MSIQETFKKHLENLTDESVDRGYIEFSYLQGRHTIEVIIKVKGNYGNNR